MRNGNNNKRKREIKTKKYMLQNKRIYLYEKINFEHKVIESALYDNVITYFVGQKLKTKRNIMKLIYVK